MACFLKIYTVMALWFGLRDSPIGSIRSSVLLVAYLFYVLLLPCYCNFTGFPPVYVLTCTGGVTGGVEKV